MLSAHAALARLREGNRRFVAEMKSQEAALSQQRRAELSGGQKPFAVVLGCSDSRVPVEIIFNQGFGDLFVIRVAGNIAAPSQIGSAEFAVEQFGTRLIVVMGHSQCGAILATLEEMRRPTETHSHNVLSIVEHLRPAVEEALRSGQQNEATLVQTAVRANVRSAVHQLRHRSDVLSLFAVNAGLLVVGAEYSLETGVVDFFDAPDDAI